MKVNQWRFGLLFICQSLEPKYGNPASELGLSVGPGQQETAREVIELEIMV